MATMARRRPAFRCALTVPAEYSFAHATMGVRLPTILGKAIEDVYRTVNEQASGASHHGCS